MTNFKTVLVNLYQDFKKEGEDEAAAVADAQKATDLAEAKKREEVRKQTEKLDVTSTKVRFTISTADVTRNFNVHIFSVFSTGGSEVCKTNQEKGFGK